VSTRAASGGNVIALTRPPAIVLFSQVNNDLDRDFPVPG